MWITNKLAEVFNRRATKTESRSGFSDDVMGLLAKGRAYPLSQFIDWLSGQQNSNLEFCNLRSAAKMSGWSEHELAKLNAYFDFFSRRYREAYEACTPFIQGKEIDLDYFGIASMVLFNSNQFEAAYRLLKRVKPFEEQLRHNFDFLIAAALISWAMGDRHLTNIYIDEGTRRDSEVGIATFNALAIYFELGDEQGFERAYASLTEEALAHPNLKFSLAFIELAQNNYPKGLLLAEARYEMMDAYRYLRTELLTQARWNRERISNKVLLIHGEQGLGDMIQTARFFGSCLEAAKAVIVECPHESIALLEYNFPSIEFVPLSQKPLDRSYDVWVGTLSLPYIYEITHDAVPNRAGYLRVPPDHLDYWRNRVNELGRLGHRKIGIAWSGYPGHRADRRRSLSWATVAPLIKQYTDVDFYAVQTRLPEDLPSNLYDCTEELITLSDTAALVEQMDLIISVDTSVVHIAGAIGKETWMMLPYRYEWRWGLEGEDSNWYDSVKVIRQPAPGAWAPVLSRVFGRRLRNFLSSKVHPQ